MNTMSMKSTTTTTERCSLLTAAALIAVVATGCGYQGPFADLIDDEKLTPPRETETPSRLAPSAAPDEPRNELAIPTDADAEEFVRLALERNPAILTAEQNVRRLANRIPQARSLDDPMFSITPIGEMAETAAGEVELMTSVSQKLPLPGKLDARGRIVAADVGEAFQELQRVRLDVTADTRRAWWSLYFTTQAIEVTRRNRDLLAQLTDVAEARYRAGSATQQDVLRASVEMNKLDDDLIELEQRRATASAMLNRLIDRPVDAPLPEPQAREPEPLSLELDAVLAMAGQSNPDIARVRERIEGFRQRLELARLNRWPDLTVSFSYNLVDSDGLAPSANGDDQWWVGAGVNLPIWTERLDAAESEAARGIFQSIAALGDVQNRVAFRVQDALVRAESQHRQVVLFRDVIIPQARQTVDASLSGYRAGKLEFLTLVDNWRRLFEFEVIYHQDLAALEQSLADLQQAVGRDLDFAPAADAGTAVRETQP
jgi:outer membrane protein TolC